MDRLSADRRKSSIIKALAVVAIIGAINWGLVGFFNWNLVNAIFGGDTALRSSALSRLIYSLVGLSGLALALLFPWRRAVDVTTSTTTTATGIGGGDRRTPVRP